MHARIVIVHHSGLYVTDVQVTRRLRRETGHYLSINGANKNALCFGVVSSTQLRCFDHRLSCLFLRLKIDFNYFRNLKTAFDFN
jgi:hypothetical protein